MRILLVFLATFPLGAQAPEQPPATDAGSKTAGATSAPAENPVPATEPWLTGNLDLGFRWLTGPQGSEAAYRSIIDLDQGPRLFGVDFTIKDPKKRLFDRIDARGYAWGDPYNTAHVEVRKAAVYDFNFDYRNIWYFNALPSFANPLAPNGFDEQSFDVRRRMLNASLELRPGKRIIPYLDFAHSSEFGHGMATWLQDASDEFAVPILPRESTRNYRAGVRFEYNKWHATVEQGGTTFKDDEQASENYLNPGDRATPFLGQSLYLNNLRQIYGIRGDSIYSRGLFTATPAAWLTFSGQFLFSQPRIDVNYSDLASGNLVVASSLLFYTTEMGLATGAAKQPHVSGNAGFELRPLKRMRIVESWMTDRYHDAAFGLFTQTLTPVGASTQVSNATALQNEQVVNYNQQQIDVMYDFGAKLALRGGWRYTWGDATVLAGTLSQSGNFALGQLKRQIGRGGLTFRPWQKLSMTVDYEGSSSDNVYFRTSLNDYNKVRAQVRYQATGSLSLQGNFTVLNNQNPAPSIRYDFQSRDNSVALYWTPNGGKRLSFTGEYDRYTLHSDIAYRNLPFFTSATSSYHENAHIATSSVDVMLPQYGGMTPKLTFGGSLFVSSLSRPTQFYEPMGRLSLPVRKNISLYAEWQWYGMSEPLYLYEGFRTHAFITGIRLSR
ncbi:MAG TPA: hypothetical protein VKT49_20375 [Bryobacteraceae bacterium]|nr:hypothetical protein [Bryobacteraceae bacterium]